MRKTPASQKLDTAQ